MWIPMAMILADKDENPVVPLIAFLVIAGLALLNRLAGAAKEKKDREKNESDVRRFRRPAPPSQADRPAPGYRGSRRPAPPAAEREADETMRPTRILRRSPYHRQAERAGPLVRPQPAEAPMATVEDELQRQQQRLRAEELERRRRLAARVPPEEDTAAIERRIQHVGHPTTVAFADGHRLPTVEIDLTDPTSARMGIVLHEVLGRPKGLQFGPQMWDL